MVICLIDGKGVSLRYTLQRRTLCAVSVYCLNLHVEKLETGLYYGHASLSGWQDEVETKVAGVVVAK